MLMGSIWELALPALVALGAILLWIARPDLRGNLALRVLLIGSVAVTAAEIMLAILIYGVFFLSGGMSTF